MLSEFGGGVEDSRRVEDVLKDKSTTHSNYVALCATTQLDKEYEIDDPNSELCLQTAKVAGNAGGEWNLKGKKSICNDTLFSELGNIPKTDSERLSSLKVALDKLGGAVKAYDQPAVTAENINFFRKKGLTEADAKGCVYALSFYTGDKSDSDKASRGGSLMIRRGNMLKAPEAMEAFLETARMILYYMVQALKHLPFYWGKVTRMITMAPNDLQYYKPGHIVTWLQFSSSCRGDQGALGFTKRNVKVIIWSIKGRHIDQFSNYGTKYGHDEDEVLFLPFTRLLVLKVETKVETSGEKHTVYCRELELGITRGFPLVWVDDQILDPNREMKGHMEAAQMMRSQELKFILKPTTELAMAYLRSPFGQRHAMVTGRTRFSNIRVMTDMSRPEEEDGERAGAKLVQLLEVERPAFNCPIMIFTSDAEQGVAKLKELKIVAGVEIVHRAVEEPESGLVYVTTSPAAALAYCQFSDLKDA